MATYLEKTHRPINCLIFVLPLLAAYEIWVLARGDRLLASQVINWVMAHFGGSWALLPAVVVVAVLLVWQLVSRESWEMDGDALTGIVLESMLWAVPLFALSLLSDRILLAGPLAVGPEHDGLVGNVLKGVGAAVFEEFLFRLVLVGGVLALAVKVFKAPKNIMLVAMVLISAVAFGWAHHNPSGRIFYIAAGGYLGAVFVTRGFGIAVGAHACYNVILAFLPGR